MTKKEIEEVRNLYKYYLKMQKMVNELKDRTLEYKTSEELLKSIPYKDIEKIKMEDAKKVLRRIYIEKAKKAGQLFNIKVYMGSYYYYDGSDSNEFSYEDDLLVLENDPRAVYRVFRDIESEMAGRGTNGDFIYYSDSENLRKYEQENTIIVSPNEEIKKSIIDASKYSDSERFHGVNRWIGVNGDMDLSIKFNRKSDVELFGDFTPLQDYFFDLLMNVEPEEAVDVLIKKYKPYRNFYDYNSIEK